MHSNPRHKLALGATFLSACAFAGGAYAATADSGGGSQQAMLKDVAHRLNVTPQKLTSALQAALADQLAAQVKAGKLTQAQANAIEQRARRRGVVPFGFLLRGRENHRFGLGDGGPGFGPGGPGFGPPIRGAKGGIFGSAAQYLGLSVPQLFDQLERGKSLAQVAAGRGKNASGLAAAILLELRSRLDQARTSGAITKAEEEQLLSHFQARVQALINRAGGPPRFVRPQELRPTPPPPGGLAAPPAPGGLAAPPSSF